MTRDCRWIDFCQWFSAIACNEWRPTILNQHNYHHHHHHLRLRAKMLLGQWQDRLSSHLPCQWPMLISLSCFVLHNLTMFRWFGMYCFCFRHFVTKWRCWVGAFFSTMCCVVSVDVLTVLQWWVKSVCAWVSGQSTTHLYFPCYFHTCHPFYKMNCTVQRWFRRCEIKGFFHFCISLQSYLALYTWLRDICIYKRKKN